MQAHTAAPAQQIQPPLHGLAKLAPVAAGFSLGLLLAAAVGFALAEHFRRSDRSWTRALLTIPPSAAALIATFLLSLPSSITALAATTSLALPVSTTAWGLHARLQDRRAGGDREARARERRGPLDPVRNHISERGLRRPGADQDLLPIGRNNRGQLAALRRGTRASGSHVLIPGATGAGKTTSLAALLIEYVVRSGFGAVVLEAKVDGGLRRAASAAAAARNRPFHLVSPGGPSSYDPLADGSVDERSERLIAVEDWGSADADFYRQAASPFLRLVIRALDATETRATLRTVARACDPDRLMNLATEIPTDNATGESDTALPDEIAAHTDALRADERRAIAGLRARLLNLADSEFARSWLDPTRPLSHAHNGTAPTTPAPGPVNLRQALHNHEVLYFRFDTDRTGNVGKAIAQMALLDLGAAASSMMGEGVGTFVAIDEFGALEASAVDRLFARGRSAGISVALGTQTVADLGQAGPVVRERIGGTVESIVCHRIGSQRDAEWIAQAIGTVPDWDTTVRTDGLGLPTAAGTRTRGYRFEVHPSQLQRLAPGHAYVARLDQATENRSKRVRVVPPWDRLDLRSSEPAR